MDLVLLAGGNVTAVKGSLDMKKTDPVHIERIKKVLATFSEDIEPALALITLEDASVAIYMGLCLGLPMERIKVLTEETADRLMSTSPDVQQYKELMKK